MGHLMDKKLEAFFRRDYRVCLKSAVTTELDLLALEFEVVFFDEDKKVISKHDMKCKLLPGG